MGIDARIKNLEKLYNESEGPHEGPEERARQNAEFAARWTRVEEKARREAEAGNPGRLQALEEIAEFMRARERTDGPERREDAV
jgi:hypothetical protein